MNASLLLTFWNAGRLECLLCSNSGGCPSDSVTPRPAPYGSLLAWLVAYNHTSEPWLSSTTLPGSVAMRITVQAGSPEHWQGETIEYSLAALWTPYWYWTVRINWKARPWTGRGRETWGMISGILISEKLWYQELWHQYMSRYQSSQTGISGMISGTQESE